jgi:nucleoside-diphosphate-sugar epimerase
MKIIVTGALGHIGSKLIRMLPTLMPHTDVVLIDNLACQRYCSLFNLPENVNYHFIEADVTEVNLYPLFEGADLVIHLAAITDAASSFKHKEQLEHVNYNGTVKVASTCMDTECPMIHISSTSVYGTQREVVDEGCSAEELQPQSPYAETKLKEERFLQEAAASGKLRFIICRFGTIAGISPGMRFHTAVNKFCWQAVMRQPLTVWRTALHQKRPYLSLRDAVTAIEFIVKNNLFDQRIYNVLTENLTVNDIVDYIRKFIPNVEMKYVDTEIMNQLSYEVSCQRIKERGFEFKGDIRQDIAETIALLRQAGGRGDQ